MGAKIASYASGIPNVNAICLFSESANYRGLRIPLLYKLLAVLDEANVLFFPICQTLIHKS